MALAGIGSFLLVWFVLRALGKPAPKQRRPRSAPVPLQVEAPKLRRADAHPDAPSRRPILAGLDLGRPLDEVGLDEAEPAVEAEEQVQTEEAERGDHALEQVETLPPEQVNEDRPGTEVHESHDTSETNEAESPAAEAELEQASPLAPARDPSVSALMERLEAGLRRREAPRWSPQPGEPADPVDARLRGAIAELQKLASRGN
jgi:hypothetical protein